jgi:hypothetical protein
VRRDHIDAPDYGQPFTFHARVIVPQCSQCIVPWTMARDDQACVDEGTEDREFGPLREINAEQFLPLRLTYSSVGVNKRTGSVVDLRRPHNQGAPEAA